MSKKKFQPRPGTACVCCGLCIDNMVCYHHLLTRKAHPEHEHRLWNLIPVCQAHHNLFHTHGTSAMAIRYEGVYNWLKEKGWHYDAFKKSWLPPAEV
jgi:5-methylcytosine-specific restriction endonuclease McrA